MKVTKSFIGLVVVFCDLIIVFSFWCSMLALKKLQDTTEKEINGNIVTPADFTVAITNPPHIESLEDLPAVYYAWVENVCAQEPKELTIPDTKEIDENQNNVWAVYLGLTNLGYLEYMKQMGKNLINKKKLIKKQRKL